MPEVTFDGPPTRSIWIGFSVSEATELDGIFADFPDRQAFRQLEGAECELVVSGRGADYKGIIQARLAQHNLSAHSIRTQDLWCLYATVSIEAQSPSLREQMRGRTQEALGPDATVKWVDGNKICIKSLRKLTVEDFDAIRIALAT